MGGGIPKGGGTPKGELTPKPFKPPGKPGPLIPKPKPAPGKAPGPMLAARGFIPPIPPLIPKPKFPTNGPAPTASGPRGPTKYLLFYTLWINNLRDKEER